ncbi:MAG: polyisoprenyl-teichoic acid--peptidoglycan teichoic acid transferase [Thermomicrobiales bacterium]|nr:polyisoprenyl-teichoic acid--peptidoglycan teichoic acid transferase [Thermomicrobiales bacterium]
MILGTPVVLVLAVLTAIGMVGYRAESTIATIHELSTPPPVVADHTEGDEPLPSGLAIDPGPAAAAVQSAEAAKNGTSAGADQPTSDDDGDLLGRLKEAAGNTADLAEGAAVAAGVKDPNSAALTLLLMGVDARPGAPIDVGVRPDALAVLRLDPATGACRLLAIPRDTRADLPGYGLTKINHALMVGGVPYQRLVVENLLGISVDGYALVDFVAFQELVDAVGGVPVDVSEAVTLRDGTDVPAGRQTMDGAQALAYARYRATTGDVGRIKRQWAVLRGLAQVEGSRDLVADVNALLPPVADHIRSDLTATDMAAIAKTHGGSCTADSVEAAVLAGTTIRLDDPLLGQAVTYNVVSDAVVRERVADLLGATSADSGHLAPGTTGARPVGRDTRRH